MDIVVSGGSDPERPIPPPRPEQHRMLQVIAVGVFLVAGAAAYTGWTVHQQAADQRAVNCAYLSIPSDGDSREYDDLEKYEKEIVDALDCDVPGR